MKLRPAGFTLIEVLACVMVLTMGLISACGLALYGLRLVAKSRAQTLALATATAVLADPSPLSTDPSLSPNGASTSGYLNGLWVVRTEVDPVILDGSARLCSVTVNVDVYNGQNGDAVLSMNRRLLRRTP
jgi:prepilin-type N-terminal cleavage/methylation domain-containing protein